MGNPSQDDGVDVEPEAQGQHQASVSPNGQALGPEALQSSVRVSGLFQTSNGRRVNRCGQGRCFCRIGPGALLRPGPPQNPACDFHRTGLKQAVEIR
jgi:hypothetical protein